MAVKIFPDPDWTELRSKTVNLTKFPFWSAIILPTSTLISVPTTSWGNIDIQPPAGETWDINYSCDLRNGTSGNKVFLQVYNASILNGRNLDMNTSPDAGAGVCRLGRFIINNANYAIANCYNNSTIAQDFYTTYSGFKLSVRFWQSERLTTDPVIPYKRGLGGRLLSFPQLKDRSFVDPQDQIRYQVFEQDLARDPNTGHIVERMVIEVTEEDLKKNLALFQADPVKTGWDKIFKHLEKEGIVL